MDVRILDNMSKGTIDNLKRTNAEVVEGDIRDKKTVSKALIGASSVIHLAAYGSVIESVKDPIENFDINVNGSFNLLNECRKSKVKKIIFSSTGGALIGNTTPPCQ